MTRFTTASVPVWTDRLAAAPSFCIGWTDGKPEEGEEWHMGQEIDTEAKWSPFTQIRPLTPEDSQRLYAFYESVQETTRAIFGKYRFTREHAEEIAGDDDASKRYYVVAVRKTKNAEETIIGLFWFWGWSKKVPWFGVMIADAYQNQGLGKAMMEYAIKESEQHGKSGILLTTAERNVRAQALYKRYGFETIGKDRNGEWLMMLNFPDDAAILTERRERTDG